LPSLQATVPLTLSVDSLTVYDSVNNFTWLADFNLPATNRFGLPVCNGMSIDPKTCVNPSGSMSYQAATAWVAAMNAANYLGHSNWEVPTTPLIDNTGCSFTGTNGNSFGFNCAGGALGYLYYNALGLKAPNSAVSISSYTIGHSATFNLTTIGREPAPQSVPKATPLSLSIPDSRTPIPRPITCMCCP